ncbi:MAG: uroporphyrinogen decarboxylase/cobalamine-independent methonine synthase family protein [Anaerolineae bacterium]
MNSSTSDATMTFREMNLRVFQRQPVPHTFFQPRIEPWYDWHRNVGQMPAVYQQLDLRGLFDDLRVSMRYLHYYTGMPDPVVHRYDSQVRIREQRTDDRIVRTYETPFGELTEELRLTVDKTWREVDFPVRTPADLRCLRWLYEHSRYSFSRENYQQGSDFVGQRGVPQFWVPKSPYQALAQIWMKLPNLIYALADEPAEVEATMRAIDAAYDPLYEQICAAGMVQIINFGENIHDHLLSPGYWQRYLLPFWHKRAGQLHAAGIFSHMHLDGYFHSLLPTLRDLPFDGIEALTPLPQGDVELEEIKANIGDKILLDGIPAVCFMPSFNRDELMAITEKVVALFAPNLVLGISDELPEGTDAEAIERVRLVSNWCRTGNWRLN